MSIDKKIGLLHAKINVSNITQKAQINWNANILKVTGNRSFEIHAQNINVSIKSSDFSYHISSEKVGQHGELFIDLNHINSIVFSSFIRNNCSNGIGFGLSINEIKLDTTQLKINITFKNKEGKDIDKRIIDIL